MDIIRSWTYIRKRKACSIHSELILTTPTDEILPGQTLEGYVRVENSQPLDHFGIIVQIEANIIGKHETKRNKVVKTHVEHDNLIADSVDSNNHYLKHGSNLLPKINGSYPNYERQFFYSPMGYRVDLDESEYIHYIPPAAPIDKGLGNPPCEFYGRRVYDAKVLPSGSHSFPFRICFKCENLPASFNHYQYGCLQYKIASYFRDWCCFVPLCEQLFNFKGHLNLSTVPECQPNDFVHKSELYNLEYPTVKAVVGVFELLNSNAGHLPLDLVAFRIKITNPNLLVCKRFSVKLIAVSKFKTKVGVNFKIGILNTNTFIRESNERQIEWFGSITIPRKASPTYVLKNIYNLRYFIEYSVYVREYSRYLHGKVNITVGTCRDNVSSISMEPSVERVVEASSPPVNVTRTRVNRLDSSSDQIQNPPSYSQLNSRCPSLESIETMPPDYNDLFSGE